MGCPSAVRDTRFKESSAAPCTAMNPAIAAKFTIAAIADQQWEIADADLLLTQGCQPVPSRPWACSRCRADLLRLGCKLCIE